jgi:hypothetical protein
MYWEEARNPPLDIKYTFRDSKPRLQASGFVIWEGREESLKPERDRPICRLQRCVRLRTVRGNRCTSGRAKCVAVCFSWRWLRRENNYHYRKFSDEVYVQQPQPGVTQPVQQRLVKTVPRFQVCRRDRVFSSYTHCIMGGSGCLSVIF